MESYKLIDSETADGVYAEARDSARKRKHHNFHSSYDEPLQRFMNVFVNGSYLRPHRHVHPPKPEVFLVLDGQMAFFIFDDEGNVLDTVVLGVGPWQSEWPVWGINVEPGTWHSIAALTERAVCFEAKPGPFSPTEQKDFAPWAPAEQNLEADQYLANLLKCVSQSRRARRPGNEAL